jgi:tetratricopeptide (TPR) repeat protein
MKLIRTRPRWIFYVLLLLLPISLLACRDRAEQAYKRGKTLEKQGNYEEAIAQFKQALELKPDHAKAYAHLGDIYRTQGKTDEALKSYRAAMEKDPQSLRGYEKLIKTLRDLGKLTEARDACLSALKSPAAQSSPDNKLELETLLKQIEERMGQTKTGK